MQLSLSWNNGIHVILITATLNFITFNFKHLTYNIEIMKKEVLRIWPELNWINDEVLREKTAKTWEIALERSVLSPEDLEKIPFTLKAGADLKVSFMAHKRCVVNM